ncbi:tryptophan halogenase [Actinoplanes sp. ATCC 53533]|uniref:tryptophan 7-halogenase n=1 Tax=Actinoplanes sp. ATCC 53533 TaxID=1288362 RepID=UPI0003874D1E|nr:tryptophan 7-halogenase [Actinoplanes sp. ATCC 53533]AGS77327.1 Halogenase [Actinoplanes sp. ATCC 53533]RSM59611.1 tryptophan halogenase [Actinoplanes sp. ATCC 53533]
MPVEEFDVVVAGGGPAGSTVASLVAMQGHRVLLLEKEVFPRYQIGESLLPSTVQGVCRMLGVMNELAGTNFRVKHGGTFRWGARSEPWTFSFADSPQLTGPTSFAYQVERARFDEILLRNAQRKGVEVREGCSVAGVIEGDERVAGLRYTDSDGGEHEVRARFVVDASGNKSRLYSSVGGARNHSDLPGGLALSGYFGRCREPAPYSGNTLIVAFESGWFWYTNITGGLSSVGAVVRPEMAEKIQGDREKAFAALIAECPLISELLSEASRVKAGKYGKLRVSENYSYHQTALWRPGMILVGDAACVMDPVLSSGVHLATYGALLAARSINSVLADDLDEKTALTEFEARYRREYGVFHDFLMSFYDMDVSEESYFRQAKKVTNSERTELESFVDLAVGLSSGEPAPTAPGGEDDAPEVPLFPGGMVASPDGMKWLPYPEAIRS